MLVILGLLFLKAATGHQLQTRIVGGSNALEGEFPYILEENIQFEAYAQPVKLPAPTDKPGDDAAAVVIGFGLNATGGQYPEILQKVDVVIFTDEYCKSTESRYDPKNHLCAGVLQGGKGDCTGDSGGPLTVDGVQYGIVSWSVKPCTNAKHPGIYVPVTGIREWITEVTGI